MTRRRIGLLLLVIGLACLLLGSWAAAQYRTATARRLFFADPFGMAAGADGRVYVGVDRREIHAYDAEGRPVAAWTVEPDAGRFRLRAVEGDRIEIAIESLGQTRLYEADGHFVSLREDREAFARFGAEQDRRVALADGAVYELAADGLARTSPPPRTLLVPVPRRPLSWLGTRPLHPITALILLGTTSLMVGAVSTAGRPAPR